MWRRSAMIWRLLQKFSSHLEIRLCWRCSEYYCEVTIERMEGDYIVDWSVCLPCILSLMQIYWKIIQCRLLLMAWCVSSQGGVSEELLLMLAIQSLTAVSFDGETQERRALVKSRINICLLAEICRYNVRDGDKRERRIYENIGFSNISNGRAARERRGVKTERKMKLENNAMKRLGGIGLKAENLKLYGMKAAGEISGRKTA